MAIVLSRARERSQERMKDGHAMWCRVVGARACVCLMELILQINRYNLKINVVFFVMWTGLIKLYPCSHRRGCFLLDFTRDSWLLL